MKNYAVKTGIIVFCALLLYTCKKKVNNPEPEPMPIIEPEPRKDSVHGVLWSSRDFKIINHQLLYWHTLNSAMFSSKLCSKLNSNFYFDAKRLVDVGDVFLNKSKLTKYGVDSSTSYNDNPAKYVIAPIEWEISGKNEFRAFNHKSGIEYPIFVGQYFIPDSINLKSDNEVYITGTNAENITITLDNGNYVIVKNKLQRDTVINFSKNELDLFYDMSFGPMTFILTLTNSEFKYYNGKFYQFVYTSVIYKTAYPYKYSLQ